MKAVTSDVYLHEMPGGQYTNLKIQANSLGLGADWDKICKSYAAANRALGDIVKVRACVCVCSLTKARSGHSWRALVCTSSRQGTTA